MFKLDFFKSFLIAIILMNTSIAMLYAQNQISGTVKDQASGSPVPYATAALLRPDSTAITGVMTNDEGKFVIENVAAGNYLLQVSLIGYEKSYRTVNVPTQSDLGEILLSESANSLQEVVVIGRRTPVVQQLDRTVSNVLLCGENLYEGYVNTSDTGSSATIFTKSFNEQITGLIIISIVWIFLRKVLKALK